MIYVIMCGGEYEEFKKPKQLTFVNGVPNVQRTIDLLHENDIWNIYISSNDERFDDFDAPRLEHENTFKVRNGKMEGYWLDAFYPHLPADAEVTFLFGDVVFRPAAIKRIVHANVKENTLVGNSVAKNRAHRNTGEPFAYIVTDYKAFMDGVTAVKRAFDEGKLKRHPIVWELYRYLNRLDLNVQQIIDRTYIAIDDGTIDIDSVEQQRLWEE